MNSDNPMRQLRIEKITVNIGVGEAGEKLVKAQKVLDMVTGHKSVQTLSKTVNRDLGIREGMPLGCKVTLRGEDAEKFLARALNIRENRVYSYSFDKEGNMSFGISDYTDFDGMKYDPEIGLRNGHQRGPPPQGRSPQREESPPEDQDPQGAPCRQGRGHPVHEGQIQG